LTCAERSARSHGAIVTHLIADLPDALCTGLRFAFRSLTGSAFVERRSQELTDVTDLGSILLRKIASI
jgi:hypothetical protein